MVIDMNEQRRRPEVVGSLGRPIEGAAGTFEAMPTAGIRKKRNVAWHRAMNSARRQAIGLLERLGPNADHLPEAARKKAHAKLVAELERVVEVIDQHLREAKRGAPKRKAAPGTTASRGANRNL
jgi:hypothetical protein